MSWEAKQKQTNKKLAILTFLLFSSFQSLPSPAPPPSFFQVAKSWHDIWESSETHFRGVLARYHQLVPSTSSHSNTFLLYGHFFWHFLKCQSLPNRGAEGKLQQWPLASRGVLPTSQWLPTERGLAEMYVVSAWKGQSWSQPSPSRRGKPPH